MQPQRFPGWVAESTLADPAEDGGLHWLRGISALLRMEL